MPMPAFEAHMIRSLFAYIFLFTAGLASAAAYFYSIHPEHVPEDDFPRVRLDLEDAVERARRAREAWEAPSPAPPQPAQSAESKVPPKTNKPPVPKREASISGRAKRK
ncbi:MAG: hypothetical protein IT356_13055 [Gemmatimonadaceae bacterium]|nr:hypothetical protein [Gemmatimonadaceae bacterium]